jgi:hypothetical protein
MLLGVLLEELTPGPFDRQKMKAGIRLADFYGTHHVRVLYSCAVLGFADEASHCGTIMPQFLTEDFEGDGTMGRVLSPVNFCGTAFSNLTLEGVPGYF